MRSRHLDVTAHTTFDHLPATAESHDWTEDAVAVLDVTSPEAEPAVVLGLELDPGDLDHLPHHVDRVPLTPDQARALAAELEEAARVTERGDAVTGRRR